MNEGVYHSTSGAISSYDVFRAAETLTRTDPRDLRAGRKLRLPAEPAGRQKFDSSYLLAQRKIERHHVPNLFKFDPFEVIESFITSEVDYFWENGFL